jgi:hypothetical protein
MYNIRDQMRFSVRKSITPVQQFNVADTEIKDLVELVNEILEDFNPRNGFTIEKNSANIAKFDELVRIYRTLDLHGQSIKNVLNPIDAQDAATKNYVDLRCDIYVSANTTITTKDEFQTFQLTAERMLFTTLNAEESVINLAPDTFYRVQVVGKKTVGVSAAIRLKQGLQVIKYLDVARNVTVFDFTVLISLQAVDFISIEVRKNTEESVEIKVTIIIERI